MSSSTDQSIFEKNGYYFEGYILKERKSNRVFASCGVYRLPACCAGSEIGGFHFDPKLSDEVISSYIEYIIKKIHDRSMVLINATNTTKSLKRVLESNPAYTRLPSSINPNTKNIIYPFFRVIRNPTK